jgi:hypothetical protein
VPARAIDATPSDVKSKHYLYAGGKRVDLEFDAAHVAVDLALAQASGLDEPQVAALGAGRPMAGGLVLHNRSEIPSDVLGELEQRGALRQVYRHGSTIAVPMPEVRIEVAHPAEHAAVLKALASCSVDSEILSNQANRIVVKPKSGTGEDALELASFVHEQARPATAAPRMVQIAPRPGVR